MHSVFIIKKNFLNHHISMLQLLIYNVWFDMLDMSRITVRKLLITVMKLSLMYQSNEYRWLWRRIWLTCVSQCPRSSQVSRLHSTSFITDYFQHTIGAHLALIQSQQQNILCWTTTRWICWKSKCFYCLELINPWNVVVIVLRGGWIMNDIALASERLLISGLSVYSAPLHSSQHAETAHW